MNSVSQDLPKPENLGSPVEIDYVSIVDAALSEWRQGDYVLDGEHWFVYKFNPQMPLEDVSKDVADGEIDIAETRVKGFVVISQTCDIVRSCSERPFIEIAPLREEKRLLGQIKKAEIPRFAFIPALEELSLVAELDLVMTVEKAIVIGWIRNIGCRNDQETRALSEALARKRIRFAFPDEFCTFVQKLRGRFIEKHSKDSDEGKALRNLREIRVRAAPSWDSAKIAVTFWFILDDESLKTTYDDFLSVWINKLPVSDRFHPVDSRVVTLDKMTARDYIESDRLDLDHLSS